MSTIKHAFGYLNHAKFTQTSFLTQGLLGLASLIGLASCTTVQLSPAEIRVSLSAQDTPAAAIDRASALLHPLNVSLVGEGADGMPCTVEHWSLYEILQVRPWASWLIEGAVRLYDCHIIINSAFGDPEHIGAILAHEIGHVLLGGGHNIADSVSIMRVGTLNDPGLHFTTSDIDELIRRQRNPERRGDY